MKKKASKQISIDVPAMAKRAEKMLSKDLATLVEILEQCAEWLDTSPAELEMAKMERAAELKSLANRFKNASDKIFEMLNSEP